MCNVFYSSTYLSLISMINIRHVWMLLTIKLRIHKYYLLNQLIHILERIFPISNISNFIFRQKKLSEYQQYIYIKPYCRIQPYLVGFLLGYFMYKNYTVTRRPGWVSEDISFIITKFSFYFASFWFC